jgi:hypothetical protein
MTRRTFQRARASIPARRPSSPSTEAACAAWPCPEGTYFAGCPMRLLPLDD